MLEHDLWRAAAPGRDEQLDADRFGVWLEVLLESGADMAARRLADMDVDLVVAALAHHLRVFDQAAVSPADPIDEHEMDGGADVAGNRISPLM